MTNVTETTNLLRAIVNIVENPSYKLMQKYRGRNRINGVGDALERFVQDSFAGTLTENNESLRLRQLESTFSYLGNQNNPPDMIIKQGDAIEVKKVQSLKSAIALNSSFPKSKLHFDDPSITSDCRYCEDWSEKDILYAIGVTSDQSLRHLWFVYGDCYAAKRKIYTRIKTIISQGVNSIEGVEFAETKELGRVNKVDPLGITNLRIRGMWHIDNPLRVFDYIYQLDEQKAFAVACLMKKSKFNSFPVDDRNNLERKHIQIQDVKIKNPNNPANLIDAVLIVFQVTT